MRLSRMRDFHASGLSRSGTRVSSPTEGLDPSQGLADPLLVLDEGEADEPFTVLAEADPGRDRDLGLLDQELCELERPEPPECFRDRGPDEHRPFRLLDAPAEAAKPGHQDVAALSVGFAGVGDARLRALERDDPRDLDRLEDAVIQVGI